MTDTKLTEDLHTELEDTVKATSRSKRDLPARAQPSTARRHPAHREGRAMFTLKTQQAIAALGDELAADAGDCSPLELAELVLDAGCLRAFGCPEALEEAERLIAAHGYKAVERAAAKVLEAVETPNFFGLLRAGNRDVKTFKNFRVLGRQSRRHPFPLPIAPLRARSRRPHVPGSSPSQRS